MALLLNLHLAISNGFVSFKIYDMRYEFNWSISSRTISLVLITNKNLFTIFIPASISYDADSPCIYPSVLADLNQKLIERQ